VAALIADRSKKVSDHGAVYAQLAPAVERFKPSAPRNRTKSATPGPVRARLLVPLASRGLRRCLPRGAVSGQPGAAVAPAVRGGGRLDLGSEVELTHLRLEKTGEGDIGPDRGTGELKAIYSGEGKQTEEEQERLSAIIQVSTTTSAPLWGRPISCSSTSWRRRGSVMRNSSPGSRQPDRELQARFADVFLKSIAGRMDDNADIFQRILDDPAFQSIVMTTTYSEMFTQARATGEAG